MAASQTDIESQVAIPGTDLDTHEAWTAVCGRDRAYAGRFLYAVATTGIYCRPGCPSRAPRREHTRFFASPEDAERAGFRPCKRCRPQDGRPPAAQRSIEQAMRFLDAHLDETITLQQLAEVVHMSPHHLQRTFKARTGLTPREYVQAERMALLRERLRAGDTVGRATFEAGYGSASRVYAQAGAHLGMTPGVYRRGGEGEQIHFALASTPVGWLLVAATGRGVCAVTLGGDADTLVRELRAEYPHAEIREDGEGVGGWVEEIVAYIMGNGAVPALPLDVAASDFQRRVWKALQEIPYGTRRSYQEVAEAIGAPGAARAVAGACASNPVALVIPCHRVVRGDGQQSGYRWGAERKAWLLEMEKDSSPDE